MQFEFSTASKIIFGPGKLNNIRSLVSDFDTPILVVSGAPTSIESRLLNLLDIVEAEMIIRIGNEPSVDAIGKVFDQARKLSPSVIVGIGGGSTIDTAKVISVLLTNPGELTDYLEVIGINKPLSNPGIPLIAIPTTAGTGSEVTRNAVIASPKFRMKVSMRSPYLLPTMALVDPELTLTLPPSKTAITGLDALTQLIEPYTSNNSNALTDGLCVEGIQRVGHSLRRAFDLGTDIHAREDMSLAALFSGICLANAKLGAVHGFAGVIGGETGAHHGAICASLLANVMKINYKALSAREPGNQVINRYLMTSKLLTGNPQASVDEGIEWIRSFCDHAGILPLSALGVTDKQIPDIISKAKMASSMRGNPILLNENELTEIMQMSL
jgi:alcohol dehydrogenase class IV